MNNDLAYIAGFWEAEGYVGIYNHKAESSHKEDRQRLEVGITNTNKEVLEWIKKKFNTGYIRTTKPMSLSRKIKYDWIVKDGNAKKFLKAIYPFLKFRQEKVKSLIMGQLSPLS